MKRTRFLKTNVILLILDIVIVAASEFAAIWLRGMDDDLVSIFGNYVEILLWRLPYLIIFSVGIYFLFSLYTLT